MSKKELMELGEFYKELRIARKLKQKDIANHHLSVSQLSKFENGQSMLSADKLILAISGIHMSFAEFGHALNNYEETSFLKLGNKIASLRSQEDIEGLKQLLIDYEFYENSDIYNRLNLLIIKESIYSLDKTFAIEKEDIEFLTRYLYEIEEWTEYELYLFGNVLSLLSNEDLIFLGKAFVEHNKLYRSIPTHQNAAKVTLLNLIMALIERKHFYYVTYFCEILEQSVTYQDMFIIVSLNFLKLVTDYIQNKENATTQKIKDYIVTVESLGNEGLAKYFRATLEQFLE